MSELEFDRAEVRTSPRLPRRCRPPRSPPPPLPPRAAAAAGTVPLTPPRPTDPQGYWRRCRGLEPAELFPYVPAAAAQFMHLVPDKPYWDVHPPARELSALVRDVLLSRWVASGGSPQALAGAHSAARSERCSLCCASSFLSSAFVAVPSCHPRSDVSSSALPWAY